MPHSNKLTRFSLYIGLSDKDNRMSNLDGVLYRDIFNRFMETEFKAIFPGCTVINTVGHWNGITEEARIVEVVTDLADADRIFIIATVIKLRLNQEAVMVTQEPVHVTFI
jgi:hypothetical protein